MCNGQSTRTSEGGVIAILKAPSTKSRPPLHREWSMRLQGDHSTGGTSACIDGFDEGVDGSPINGHLVIHRDGDLRSLPSSTEESSILHRITLPKSFKAGTPFLLHSKLDLGVGGDGIIGRRVSLLTGGGVLGEGIAGFN
ncbi:uncharacterized protein LTR77_003553 [Saxophila tyrrhenica]|uniref:Uncharacterized protein n=1 Tax=Saxophila tyrrhenica TaxID=1690608 RepID=A0AAV9PHD6_9PEZI|nr:hypothetical protein LTR77_003553 [Saxophila tyrrhenica]